VLDPELSGRGSAARLRPGMSVEPTIDTKAGASAAVASR
jgi:hypothetical protein